MLSIYIVKIGPRRFVCNDKNKFIVNNVYKSCIEGSIISLQTWNVSETVSPIFINCKFKVYKVLKNKVITFKKNRRKSYTRTKNDSNYVAYLGMIK